MRSKSSDYIIGIDEAGRGPLAGPVAVGGVRIVSSSKYYVSRMLRGIKDSKQLSERQREEWFLFLTAHPALVCAVVFVSPAMIDALNIRQATLLGAARVYRKLTGASARDSVLPSRARVMLDGGLFLPPGIGADQQTIIRGDEKIPLIAAASIIAKVRRDRLMMRLHKKYPEYRFDLHKGYGTVLHRAMIAQFGRCEAHRQSFRVDNPTTC